MNTLPFSSTLDHLIGVTSGTATNHGVQQEAVLLHILALAATSDAITHQPTGQQVTPAKFSLLIQTPDFRLPPWVSNEWFNAWYHRTYNSKGQPRIMSEPVAIGLPRSERILAALQSRHDSLQKSAIEDQIDDGKLC